MPRILLVPGLVCDAHVWHATFAALDGRDVVVGEVTRQDSITAMAPLKDGELSKREAMIAYAHSAGMDGLAETWLPGMMADGITPDRDVMDGLRAMVRRMTPDIHERQIRALIGRPDATRTMPDYAGPLLLVTGRQDIWSPIAQHEEIAALCPQARLEIIDQAGHFAPVEQPAQVAGLLADWIATLAPMSQENAQ